MVIDPTVEQLRALVRCLPATEYDVDLDAAIEAHRSQSQFSIVDFATGWKIDLIIRKPGPFSLAEFDRRAPVDLHGLHLFVASAEDVVISKFEWAKLGHSERQIEDVAALLRIRSEELDRTYMGRWIGDLGLAKQWKDACRLAGIVA